MTMKHPETMNPLWVLLVVGIVTMVYLYCS